MYKYKKPLEKHEIDLLAKLASMDFSNMTEQDVREEYIAPLLTLMGYQKNTDYEVEREEYSSLKDMSIQIGSKNLKLDYKFNIRKKYFWLIEAKNGKEKEISKDDVGQAYLYSLHPDLSCRFFAVCNGWTFNLYDRNRGIYADANVDLFEPILTIISKELNEQKFNELYSFLGSSEIMFKVKEDILLQDIKNTLSAEIYMDRLKEFSRKVDQIINSSSREVLKNIQKNNANWREDLDKRQKELETILAQQTLQSIVDTIFNGYMSNWQLSVACKVIKDKLLPYKKFTIEHSNGYGQSDAFFAYLFLQPVRAVKIDYFYNIIGLIKYLATDSDLQGMIWRHWNKDNQLEMIEISQMLDFYIADMFNFFENRKELRALVILYPIYYRIAKFLIYGIADDRVRAVFNARKIIIDKFFTEEELSKSYHSLGHEIIDMAQSSTIFVLNKFIQRAFVRRQHGNVIKETLSMVPDAINGEIIKKEILDAEMQLDKLNELIDIDKLRKQLPGNEEDEMFSFDKQYKNPWFMLFIYAIRLSSGYKFSQRVLEQIKKMTELGFLYIDDYIAFMCGDEVLQAIHKNRNLVKQFEIKLDIMYKPESEKEAIVSNLKSDW